MGFQRLTALLVILQVRSYISGQIEKIRHWPVSLGTSLQGKKEDGHALVAHWVQGQAAVAYPKKVAVINVEAPWPKVAGTVATSVLATQTFPSGPKLPLSTKSVTPARSHGFGIEMIRACVTFSNTAFHSKGPPKN